MGRAAMISFRLGGTDGVSIVAETWIAALERLGWEVVTVAGSGPVDRLVPELGLDAVGAPDRATLRRTLADIDLAVVTNALTIPLRVPASLALADVRRGRPTLLHHHDPPWQRTRFADDTDLPIDDPAWRHVTINALTATQFAARGFEADVIYNGFDPDPPAGHRDRQRAQLGVAPDEPLVVHPVRAIERKNLPAAIALTEALGATYWLTGPAEEGYRRRLDELIGAARCRVIHQQAHSLEDLYAAADLVVFPSTWEGFGNPPVEAGLAGKPVLVGNYPVADELRALGAPWPRYDWRTDPVDQRLLAAARDHLDDPDRVALDAAADLLGRAFSLEAMTRRLELVLERAGWKP